MPKKKKGVRGAPKTKKAKAGPAQKSILDEISALSPDHIDMGIDPKNAMILGACKTDLSSYYERSFAEINDRIKSLSRATRFSPLRPLPKIGNRENYNEIFILVAIAMQKYKDGKKSIANRNAASAIVKTIIENPLFTELSVKRILDYCLAPKKSDFDEVLINLPNGERTKINKSEANLLLNALTLVIICGFIKGITTEHYHACILATISTGNVEDLKLLIARYHSSPAISLSNPKKKPVTVALKDLLIGKTEKYQTDLDSTNLVIASDIDTDYKCLEFLMQLYQHFGIDPDLTGDNQVTTLHSTLISLQSLLKLMQTFRIEGYDESLMQKARTSLYEIAQKIKIALDFGCSFDRMALLPEPLAIDEDIPDLASRIATNASDTEVVEGLINEYLCRQKTAKNLKRSTKELERRHVLKNAKREPDPEGVNDMLMLALFKHKPDCASFLTLDQEILGETITTYDFRDKETIHRLISHNIYKLIELSKIGAKHASLSKLERLQAENEFLQPLPDFDLEKLKESAANHDIIALSLLQVFKIGTLMEIYERHSPKTTKRDLVKYEKIAIELLKAELTHNPQIKLCVLASMITGIDAFNIQQQYPDHGISGEDYAEIAASSLRLIIKNLGSKTLNLHDQALFTATISMMQRAYRSANSKKRAGDQYDTLIAYRFNPCFIPHADETINNFAHQVISKMVTPDLEFDYRQLGLFCLRFGMSLNFQKVFFNTKGKESIHPHFATKFFKDALYDSAALLAKNHPDNRDLIQGKFRISYLVAQHLDLSEMQKSQLLGEIVDETDVGNLTPCFALLIASELYSKAELLEFVSHGHLEPAKKVAIIAAIDGSSVQSSTIELDQTLETEESIAAFLRTANKADFVDAFTKVDETKQLAIIEQIKKCDLSYEILDLLLRVFDKSLTREERRAIEKIYEHEDAISKNLDRNIALQLGKIKSKIEFAIYCNNEELLLYYLLHSEPLLLAATDELTFDYCDFIERALIENMNFHFPSSRNNLVIEALFDHIQEIKGVTEEFKRQKKQSIAVALFKKPEVSYETIMFAINASDLNPFANIIDGRSLFEITFSDPDRFKNVKLKKAILEYCLRHRDLPALSQEQVNSLAISSIDWNYDQDENKILNKLFELGYDLPAPDFTSDELCPIKQILISRSKSAILTLKRSKHQPLDKTKVNEFVARYIHQKEVVQVITQLACNVDFDFQSSVEVDDRGEFSHASSAEEKARTKEAEEEAAVNAAELIKEEGRLLEEKAKNAARKAAKKAKAHQEKLRAQQEAKEKAQRKAEEQKRLQLEKEAQERAKQEAKEKAQRKAEEQKRLQLEKEAQERAKQEALAKERKEELQRQQEALAKERQIAAFKERRIKRIAQRAATKWRQNVVDSKNMQGRADQFHKGKLARKAWQAWKSYQEKARAEKTFINEIDSSSIRKLLDKFKAEQDPKRQEIIEEAIISKTAETSHASAFRPVTTAIDRARATEDELQQKLMAAEAKIKSLQDNMAQLAVHNGDLQSKVYDLSDQLRSIRGQGAPFSQGIFVPAYPHGYPYMVAAMHGPPPPTHFYPPQLSTSQPDDNKPSQKALNPKAEPFHLGKPSTPLPKKVHRQ